MQINDQRVILLARALAFGSVSLDDARSVYSSKSQARDNLRVLVGYDYLKDPYRNPNGEVGIFFVNDKIKEWPPEVIELAKKYRTGVKPRKPDEENGGKNDL